MANILLKKLDNHSKDNLRLYVIGGIVVFGIGIGIWFNSIYLSPNNVFWDSFANNLSTNGFTKSQAYFNGTYDIDQKVQLSLGANNYSHSITTLTQGKKVVTTEEINSPNYEYVRYLNIATDQKAADKKSISYKKDLNIWGYSKNSVSANTRSTQTFYENLFGIVPFGNLPSNEKNQLVSYARENKVYKIDYKSIKNQTINGKSVVTLNVSVSRYGYTSLMKMFAKDVGFKGLDAVNPKQYKSLPPITMKFSIEPISRNLVQLDSGSKSGQLSYSGFGIDPQLKLPTKFISLIDLETKIRNNK